MGMEMRRWLNLEEALLMRQYLALLARARASWHLGRGSSLCHRSMAVKVQLSESLASRPTRTLLSFSSAPMAHGSYLLVSPQR